VNTELTNEMKELIDREADLISRNRPHKSMERLRLRLSNLFLQFLQDPQYNPRASDFLKEKIPSHYGK
jgi:IQ and ubiquitin-like domain-containing protein